VGLSRNRGGHRTRRLPRFLHALTAVHAVGAGAGFVMAVGSAASDNFRSALAMSRLTIFEAAGGSPAIEALTVRFYEKAKADPLLSPVFASSTAEHAKNVAIWLGEVFGGPPRYSEEHGGHRTVLERHRNLGLSPDQKVGNTSSAVSSIADYIRWGAQIAVTASQPGFEIQHVGPVPKWGWTTDKERSAQG
jgi:hemoglobin